MIILASQEKYRDSVSRGQRVEVLEERRKLPCKIDPGPQTQFSSSIVEEYLYGAAETEVTMRLGRTKINGF